MRLGVTCSSPHTLPLVRELIKHGHADFCELTVDNFAHLPAQAIRQVFADIPLSLHIIASRFLEKSAQALSQLAQHLRPWIKQLQPLYVSDHLIRYTSQEKRLPLLAELDYENDYLRIKQGVSLWQELLDTPLLFENHASITTAGQHQAAFYTALLNDTQADLLFDFSNAYIAQYNGVCAITAWESLIKRAHHFHVSGFRLDATQQVALDTHDAPIDQAVITAMQPYLTQGNEKTLVIEFDGKVKAECWQKERARVLC